MTGPLAHQFAQANDALEHIARVRPEAAPYIGPSSEIRDVLSVIERHLEDMGATYPATPVDCLISELRDSFSWMKEGHPMLDLPTFEKRVAQFNAEVAALSVGEERSEARG